VDTFATNVMGTVNILECLRQSTSAQMAVIVTTDKCYLNLEKKNSFQETDALGGHDCYSASKAAAENVFSAYSHSFFHDQNKSGTSCKIASARAGNVIGGGDWSEDRIFPDCVRQWSQGQPVVLRSPESVRPWQHVLDSLHGYLQLGDSLIQGKTKSGESFNFGPEEESQKTVLQLVQEAEKFWPNAKHSVDQTLVGSKKESQHLFLNCQKAKTHLQWRPLLNFTNSVQLATEWYKEWSINPSSAESLVQKQIRFFNNLNSN
jgi:CDP-glucose 4,6-dehydratase